MQFRIPNGLVVILHSAPFGGQNLFDKRALLFVRIVLVLDVVQVHKLKVLELYVVEITLVALSSREIEIFFKSLSIVDQREE